MPSQTISLFRYQVLGILSLRNVLLYLVLLGAGVLLTGFVGELAIISGESIEAATLADFGRYSLLVMVVLVVASSVVEDFQFGHFSRLLTMPLARWQYVAAQVLVIGFLCALLVLPFSLLLGLVYTGWELAVYWLAGLWLELWLFGLVAFLAVLSLEKLPVAVFFTLAIVLLCKLSALISAMVSESVRLSEGSLSSQFVQTVFDAILYCLPGHSAFANNNVFFVTLDPWGELARQLVSVGIYALLLIAACLVDFYRKEVRQ